MSKVFVLDTNKQPLDPVHPGHARLLLKQGQAAVYRRYPFTLILKRAVEQPALHPLRDAAAVNATGFALYERLKALGLPVECGSGGRTKYNRTRRNLPKAHWLDAACVGASTPERLMVKEVVPLLIRATGHGSRQMCRMDRFGFPRTGPKQHKRVQGFQTGDLVRAVVTTGQKVGTYVGHVAVRTTGSFNISTQARTVQGIHDRFCRVIQRCDGYSYQKGEAAFPPAP